MKKLVLLAVVLSACGEYNPCPETNPDFVAGMCINRRTFDIEYDKVEETIFYTEKFYNWFYPDDQIESLPQFLDDNNVKLDYWALINPSSGGFTRGTTTTENADGPLECALVNVLGWGCGNQYFVLSHEVLHVIASRHLDVAQQINAAHMTDHFFIGWAEANELHHSEVIEWLLLNEISEEICEQPYRNK